MEMAALLTRRGSRRPAQPAPAPGGARRGLPSSNEQEVSAPGSLKRARTGSASADSQPEPERQAPLAHKAREAAGAFDPGGGDAYDRSDTESEMKEDPPGDERTAQAKDAAPDLAEDEDISRELGALAAKNELLRTDMRGLKRKLSQRRKDHDKIQLRLSSLDNVASELSVLQREYQEYSRKNVALVQQLLAQIGRCADQVDNLKQSRGLTQAELRDFRLACTQEMNRLKLNLDQLQGIENSLPAHGYAKMGKPFAMDDVAPPTQQQQYYELVYDQNSSVYDNIDMTSASSSEQPQPSRIDVVSRQLDELRDQVFHVQQSLQQNNQSFREQLEDLLAQQMTRIREVQDDEAERLYEEMDGLRTGMITILKDLHILKERTKYMVPNMAKAGNARLRRHRKVPVSASNPLPIRVRDPRPAQGGGNTPGYSLMMTTRMCDNRAPHPEHGYSSDWYCPGIPEEETPAPSSFPYTEAECQAEYQAGYKGGGAQELADDAQWVQYREGDTRRELDQPPCPPCESPHYSSRSSGVSDRLSVNEDHVVPVETAPDEALERRLLEQHRQFWIVEGAG